MNAVIKSSVNQSGVIAEIRLVDSARNKVASKVYDNLSLTANSNTTLQFNYQSPSTLAPGTYKIEVGVWDKNWATLLYMEGMSQFAVVAPTPVQPQPAPPIPAPVPAPAPVNYVTPAISLLSLTAVAPTVTQGAGQSLKAQIISNTKFTDLIVAIRVYNSAHTQVLAKTFTPVSVTANVQSTLQYDFSTASLPLGTYTVETGVWDSLWKTYVYESSPSPFTVTAPVPVTPTILLSGVTLSNTAITQSGTQTITTKLKSNVAAKNLIVDVRIFNSANTKVANKLFDGAALDANVDTSFVYAAPMSTLAPGNYTVVVGVWDQNWKTFLYAESLAPFTVSTTVATVPAPLPVPVVVPTPVVVPPVVPTAPQATGSLAPVLVSNNLIMNPGFELDGVGYNKDG